MTNEVTSGGGATVVHPAGASVNLDKVTALIRKEVVVPAAAKVEAQQAKQKELAPDATRPEMHHVSEGFVGSVVRSAADQGLINQIIELVIAELLKAFNKPHAPKPPTP